MLEIRFAIVMFISSMGYARDITEQLNHIATNSIGSSQYDIGKTQDSDSSWHPPSSSQHNWILLNAALKRDSTSTGMASNNLHRNNIFRHAQYGVVKKSSNANAQLNFLTKDRQEYSHRFPINYYTDNHSSDGNYIEPTAADVKLIEPYIVTISEMRTSPNINRNSILKNIATDASATYSNAVTLPKDIIGNPISQNQPEKQDIKVSSQKVNRGGNNDAKKISVSGENNEESESLFDRIEADSVYFRGIFLPLQRTLDKVKQFCDIAKRFISNDGSDDDENDADHDDDNEENEYSNNNAIYNKNGSLENPQSLKTSKTDKVQGHRNVKSAITGLSLFKRPTAMGRNWETTSKEIGTLTSDGSTGRKIKKLKKKLNKFIIPLLLAYKLKFLTLIPVLIGGLILLVGTTGLAGFFFALFTAVMSLKSAGNSKSIIVKKI